MLSYLSDINIAEPHDVTIDEIGNNVTSMYQFIGNITDTKVGGLVSFSKFYE